MNRLDQINSEVASLRREVESAQRSYKNSTGTAERNARAQRELALGKIQSLESEARKIAGSSSNVRDQIARNSQRATSFNGGSPARSSYKSASTSAHDSFNKKTDDVKQNGKSQQGNILVALPIGLGLWAFFSGSFWLWVLFAFSIVLLGYIISKNEA